MPKTIKRVISISVLRSDGRRTREIIYDDTEQTLGQSDFYDMLVYMPMPPLPAWMVRGKKVAKPQFLYRLNCPTLYLWLFLCLLKTWIFATCAVVGMKN